MCNVFLFSTGYSSQIRNTCAVVYWTGYCLNVSFLPDPSLGVENHVLANFIATPLEIFTL